MKKRAISLFLTVLMLLSLVPAAALAEDSNMYPEDRGGLLVFGDSFSRGMGCSDTWQEETADEYQYGDTQSRCVTGAYPTLLAASLGCTNSPNNHVEEKESDFWPIIHNGLTLSAVCDLLGVEDNYYDDGFYHATWTSHYTRYGKFLEYFGNPESFSNDHDGRWGGRGTTYDIRSIVENTDNIVLQLGQGDVLNLPVFQALHEFTGGGFNFSGMGAADIAAFIARIIELANEQLNQFKNAYPKLLKYITSANTEGNVLVVSIVNPAFGAAFSEDIALQIGQVFSVLSASMNTYLKKWCKEYGATFVDISNVETATTENGWSIIDDYFAGGGTNYEIATHPSPEGHRQIARLLLREINRLAGVTETAPKDIVVDIGRFDSVDSVRINGIPISEKNYTVEDHVLTVHCRTRLATSLTISAETDGKTALTTYQLVYKDGGYDAYRTYTTNDFIRLIDILLDPIKSLFAKIYGKISFIGK